MSQEICSTKRSALRSDIFFALMGVFGIAILALESTADRPAIAAPDDPIIFVSVTMALIIAFAFFVTRMVRIDRKKSDEFLFGMIGHSAIIAVITTILCHAVMGQGFLLGGVFGKMSADSMLGVLNASWAAGYFFYRIRGTTA